MLEGAELETKTEEEDSALNLQQRETTSMDTQTIVIVKQELIEQNASIRIQNNYVEGDDDYRNENEATIVNLQQRDITVLRCIIFLLSFLASGSLCFLIGIVSRQLKALHLVLREHS